jgi:GH25 family lysozyme M1 (1,4-beta-N-acetylmuramidase)
MKGIDVSKHNDVINWGEVASSGIEFAIIRAGYGKFLNQKDIRFEENYKGAVNAGLHVGAYWYSYAKNGEEALEEAKVFYQVIKGKKFDYPVFLDIEEKCSRAYADDIVSSFCGYLESKGYYVGVYASKSFIESYISYEVISGYCTWVAQWSDSSPSLAGPSWAIWQYSDSGTVNGIQGNVDMNECRYLLSDTIIRNGFNGYAKEKVADSSKKIKILIDDTVVYEGVIE